MIEYLDLVGRPWREMDCKSAVSVALARMGIDVAPDAWAGRPELWERIATADTPGDVVLSRSQGSPHVSVLLDARSGLCLTSVAPVGVQVVTLGRVLPGSLGVYRYRTC